MRGQGALQQLPTNAAAAHLGINEQGLHVRAVDQHETLRPVLRIHGHGQCRLRQEAGHFNVDGLPVFGTEEVMGGIDGASPEVDQAVAVAGTGRAQGGH